MTKQRKNSVDTSPNHFFDVETTFRRIFPSSELQCLPLSDPRNLRANTRIRLLATHPLTHYDIYFEIAKFRRLPQVFFLVCTNVYWHSILSRFASSCKSGISFSCNWISLHKLLNLISCYILVKLSLVKLEKRCDSEHGTIWEQIARVRANQIARITVISK